MCRNLKSGNSAKQSGSRFVPGDFFTGDLPSADVILMGHILHDWDLPTKQMLIGALSDYEGTMLFVSHDRHFLAALSNRTLELTPEGPHRYDGGYVEYVARTGQEAPGLRD